MIYKRHVNFITSLMNKLRSIFLSKWLIMALLVVIAAIASSYIADDNLISYNIKNQSNNIVSLKRSSDEFLIGAVDNRYDYNFTYIDSALGLNLWHCYSGSQVINGKHYPDGMTYWAPNDHLFSSIEEYQSDVLGLFQSIGSHNMKAWFQRPKVAYLVYGQRSDYRCVDTQYVDPDLWFYTFQSPEHVGIDIPEAAPFGDGNYVRYCSSSSKKGRRGDNPGLVVSRLRTNTEQCHRGHDYDAWCWDSEHDWFIKPRIRIDSAFAHSNPESPVCNIKVIAIDGVTQLRNVDIKAGNFIDLNGNYDGRYIDEYYNLPGTDSLIIHGDWGDNWVFNSRGNNPFDVDNCPVDIKVYWYGNCDMWIDRVRVDNDIANDLLSTDTTNVRHRQYLDWLRWEAEDIACQGGDAANKMYIELFEFNQIPCMAFINRTLDSLCNRNVGIIPVTFTFYQYHMSWADRGTIMKPDQIIRQYVNKLGTKEILIGHLPFTSIEENTYSRIPNTLPIISGSEILGLPASPANYDAWLQGNLDTFSYFDEGDGIGGKRQNITQNPSDPCPRMPQYEGKFRWELELGSQISKQANIPFVSWAQAHQFFLHCGEIEREPTSEEMDLTANIPVSYGAKGIIYFAYPGWQQGVNYAYGFTETADLLPRYTNVYGQPKWDKFIEIFKRLKKWSPFVMNFDNSQTNSYIYRLENQRQNLINNSYFKKITTLKPGLSDRRGSKWSTEHSLDEVKLIDDFQNQTYVQAATFKEQNTGNLYFMIINKRCSPFVDETSDDNLGGKRWIEILFKFYHPDINSSNIWIIRDVIDTGWTAKFDKSLNREVSLGAFMPGEGRLYSLQPDPDNVPFQFNLYQNYPNPFNPVTNIKYSLPGDADVVIKVYDIIGREVRTLVNGFRKKGYYDEQFDGRNFASGVYFYKITAGNYSESRKMVLVK